MEYLSIFVSGFFMVFLLGFQSRLVNHGNFKMAALCSFTVAQAQFGLWTAIMQPGMDWTHALVYGLSGATAITTAMWLHVRMFMKKEDKQ